MRLVCSSMSNFIFRTRDNFVRIWARAGPPPHFRMSGEAASGSSSTGDY
jgi:hypothetical protein